MCWWWRAFWELVLCKVLHPLSWTEAGEMCRSHLWAIGQQWRAQVPAQPERHWINFEFAIFDAMPWVWRCRNARGKEAMSTHSWSLLEGWGIVPRNLLQAMLHPHQWSISTPKGIRYLLQGWKPFPVLNARRSKDRQSFCRGRWFWRSWSRYSCQGSCTIAKPHRVQVSLVSVQWSKMVRNMAVFWGPRQTPFQIPKMLWPRTDSEEMSLFAKDPVTSVHWASFLGINCPVRTFWMSSSWKSTAKVQMIALQQLGYRNTICFARSMSTDMHKPIMTACINCNTMPEK